MKIHRPIGLLASENQGQTLATSGCDVMLAMNETVMALVVDGFPRATA